MSPKTSPVTLKHVIGSIACGRFDTMLRRSLNRARIDFNGICDVYGQAYDGLEQLLSCLVDNDDGTMGDFVIEVQQDDEEQQVGDDGDAGDIFLHEVLPAFAEEYPDAVLLSELEFQNIHKHPIVIGIAERNALTPKMKKELTAKVEHAVLEDIATPLID